MKKFTLLVLSLSLVLSSLTVFANAAVTSFTDVPTGSWYYDAVMSCASNGYVSGVGDNKFVPEGKLTYAQIMTMYTNAFYKEAKQDYENNKWKTMDDYFNFNGNPSWYGYNAYYFKDNGLLDGTNANIKSASNMSSPISRYEVVQIVYNILNDHGISITDNNKNAAKSQLSDGNSIPAQYQDAVTTCFFKGIISGFEDGSFRGDETLTRAQGCVILNKLVKSIGNANGGKLGSGHIDSTTEPPETPPAVDENAPKLANGKPVTEENVLAILAEIQKEYPDGTPWGLGETPGDNYYKAGPSTIVRTLLETGYGTSAKYACGGFAAMVSDRIFGRNEYPVRRVTDPMDIRPGDIIVQLTNGKVNHVAIAGTATIQSGTYAGRVWTADGNTNGHVSWPDYKYGSPTSEAFNKMFFPANTWEVWTRYPD